ncbi:RNA polymerase sigma factor [uncultured Kocuria sp.]|uniref:RNA polymerase sigma factor n=1 Tax=uncultured Kocuria sp. TaxID=259305 RepID=UPI002593892E|nr:sigma-70 family RNA polymerase sigma factor [uncultured Kocuria sp.]MCT1368008.1 sigma-70 family RNA polymerase sigma factor [Rothia sp. p3-SID1597]
MNSDDEFTPEYIATLVLRAQDGDLDSFARLVDRYQAPLLRLSYRMLGNRADAEDVAQESLVKAWTTLEHLAIPEAFPTWLYRQAVNRCKDILRSPKRSATVPIDETNQDHPSMTDTRPANDPQRVTEVHSSMDELSRLLLTLPEDQRACWVLREYMGLSYAEISETLATPVATVRGRLSRARARLAQDMKEWR